MILDLGKPTPKQELFLKATARHVAFGGARGGGKSHAVRLKSVLMAERFAGIKVLIIRRTYQELVNNHVDPLRKMLHGIAKYNKTDKCFTFPNGSIIKMGYCSNDSDVEQYQGSEWDVVFYDESTLLKWEWIEKINIAIRGTNGFPKRSYYTMNPNGVSHSDHKRRFIDRKFDADENPDDWVFIQSLVTDNTYLMEAQPEYIQILENLPPKLRAMWLEGRWDVAEGMFFEDFRVDPDPMKVAELGIDPDVLRDRHQWCHVIKPFDIPRGWTILRSMDFGYSKPSSVGYWALDYEGTLYRILELYFCTQTPNEGTKLSPDEQFRQISEFEHSHPWLKGKRIDGVADPAIWDASRGESINDTAVHYGVFFTKGDNNRFAGWMQFHYRLQFDEHGYPRMYIFDNCKAFIRTIPSLMYSEKNPEDLDTTMEDHVADETRYLLMSRPIAPMKPIEKKVVMSDPLNQFTRG